MSIYTTTDTGELTVKSSTKARINTVIEIVGTGTQLPVSIVGNFKDIPGHLHQIYMEAMLASYGKVDVHNNTEEEPMTVQEKKSKWRLNRIVDILTGKK